MPYVYQKSGRLRKNTEFVATMKGKRLSLDGLSLFYTTNSEGNFRVGISVSKKMANAVKRNKVKRRIRNCVMKALGGQSLAYDLVFVARQGLYDAPYGQIMHAVETVLRKSIFLCKHPEGARS
jgi:ribonuclease P protein component